MKYKVEVGGFVTVFRRRRLEIHADSIEEAEEKAKESFVEIQKTSGGDCSRVTVVSCEPKP